MRCGRCGAEVKPGLRVCAKCGANMRRPWPWARFVRCRSCQARVPSGLSICPFCGGPLKRSWRRPVLALAALLAVALLGYTLQNYFPWAEVRALRERAHLPDVAFLSTATFTAQPTPTRTRTATATSSPTPTRTPVPATETPTPEPPTDTPRPLRTATPTPRFTASRLLSPGDGMEFQGGGSPIVLSWESAGALAEDEWYGLSLRFLAGGVLQYSGTWTKETSWIVPPELYRTAGQAERAFQWDVTIMRETGTKSEGGRDGVPLAPTSETHTFYWY